MFPNSWQKLKEFVGISDQNELLASAEMALSDRLASPFYGYFIISWLLVNWSLVYAALFINQEILFDKTGLLRTEYVTLFIPNVSSTDFWLQFIIGPIALSIIAIFFAPYGTRVFYRQSVRNRVALKVIELQELRQERKEEVALAKDETALIKSELDRAKIEREAARENPEVLWEQEFKKFLKNLPEVFKLPDLQQYAYANTYLSDSQKQRLAYLHLIGLINFYDPHHVELTEKGKFFLRRYIEAANDDPRLSPPF